MRARECAEQLGQPVRREILGDAEPDRAFAVRLAQHVARLLGQREQTARVGQQPLAGLGRAHSLAVAMQQHLADVFLQPLDLLADGRLGAVDACAGPGEAAGLDHRHEAAQQLEIEHGGLHSKIHLQ